MDEDTGLNAAIKEALESGVTLQDKTLDAIVAAAEAQKRDAPSPGRLWWGASLAAASILFVVMFSSVFRARERDRSFAEVIQFLSDMDGMELHVDGKVSAEELLFAWQEAPLAEIGI